MNNFHNGDRVIAARETEMHGYNYPVIGWTGTLRDTKSNIFGIDWDNHGQEERQKGYLVDPSCIDLIIKDWDN